MNINTRNMAFVNFNGQEMQFVKFNGVTVYESWKELTANGVPPLILVKCKGADLVDYKIYGNSVQKIRLPKEYQEVGYIEGTGTQYIEINYVATEKTNSKGVFQITDVSKGLFLFGSRTGSTSINCYGLNWGGGTPYKYYNTYYGLLSEGLTTETIDDKKHTFEKKAHQLYLDGILIHTRTDTDGTKAFTTPTKMIVFGCNTKGNIGLLAYARIFNLQFYDNDILKVDLIPCYRKSDNVVGMYDLVTGTFYTNKGTGTFLKGNNAPTPDAPIEVESVGDYDEETGKYKIPVRVNDTITNIYLNEPLRKIGDYADYIDFEKGKVVRTVNKQIFTGGESFSETLMTNALTFRINNKLGGICLCSHFVNKYPLPTSTQRYWGYMTISSLKESGIGFFIVNSPYTLEEFKQYLSIQYSNGTPVEVYYVLAEPDDTETIELPNIPLNKGTNNIEVDTKIQPSNMEVVYKGKEVK